MAMGETRQGEGERLKFEAWQPLDPFRRVPVCSSGVKIVTNRMLGNAFGGTESGWGKDIFEISSPHNSDIWNIRDGMVYWGSCTLVYRQSGNLGHQAVCSARC